MNIGRKIARKRVFSISLNFLVAAMSLGIAADAWGQGVALRSVSAINESMGGAATACPLDAAGAIHWNPASISDLPASEISFSFGLILPQSSVSSSLANGMHGTNYSETGAIPVPSMACVKKSCDSDWTFGLGIYGIGGSRVNYTSSSTNPVLLPQPLGLGRLSAEVEIYQIAPTASYQLTDKLSVGFAPTITMAKLVADPLFLGPLDGTRYMDGVGTRYAFGGGFQIGAYYKTDYNWNFGAALKSPQWMEDFRYYSTTAAGATRIVKYDLDYPMIFTAGASYTGFEKWTLAMDMRYFDYANTPGFGSNGFAADGSLSGLDWNSIMSLAFGAQRIINDRLSVRMGYSFNENPIDSGAAMYNTASPLVIQHCLHSGLSYTFADNWITSLAYVHCFEGSASGEIKTWHGTVAGSNVTSKTSADAVYMGVTKRF